MPTALQLNDDAVQLKEQPYLHILRVVAALAVVFIHTLAKETEYLATSSIEWQCINIIEVFVRWAVPAFLMISGVLFLDNERQLPLKKLYGKYILRISTALIFWSMAYAIAYQGIIHRNGIAGMIRYLRWGPTHLWYLYVLLGIYLVVPLLRRITASEESTRYYLVLWVITVFVLPMFNPESVVNLIFNRLNFSMTLGYSGYFVAGYWLNKQEIGKKVRIAIYSAGILAMIFVAAVTGIVSAESGTPYIYFYEALTLPILIESVAIFIFVRYELNNIKVGPLITKLSKYSFGIYLIHQSFIDAMSRLLGLNVLSFNPFISAPIIAVLCFSISAIVTAVISRIPVLNKYII